MGCSWHSAVVIVVSLMQLSIGWCCAVLRRSVMSDSTTPWTVAHQAPLSMGILQARILAWIVMPSSRGCSQPRDQTSVSCVAGWILYHLNHQGSPRILEWVAYPFSLGSSWPRNQTKVSCVAGGFFTGWATREAQVLARWDNVV